MGAKAGLAVLLPTLETNDPDGGIRVFVGHPHLALSVVEIEFYLANLWIILTWDNLPERFYVSGCGQKENPVQNCTGRKGRDVLGR